MMVSLGVYVRRGQRRVKRLLADPKLHATIQFCAYLLAGFLLSAASLNSRPQPLALGLLCASSGWPCVLLAAGSMAGYLVFWGAAGSQGIVWIALGLILLALVLLNM